MNTNNKFHYLIDKEVKKSLNCKVIDLPIYKCRVKFLFGKKAEKLEKDWKRDIKGFGGLTRSYLKDYGEVLISFPVKNPPLSNVVHELYHATEVIMDSIEHEKNTETDEPSAYLMGYLLGEYLKIKK